MGCACVYSHVHMWLYVCKNCVYGGACGCGLSMLENMHICLWVTIHMYMITCECICIYMHMYEQCAHTWLYVYIMCASMYIYTYTHVWICDCIYVLWVHTNMYVCTPNCAGTHLHMHVYVHMCMFWLWINMYAYECAWNMRIDFGVCICMYGVIYAYALICRLRL